MRAAGENQALRSRYLLPMRQRRYYAPLCVRQAPEAGHDAGIRAVTKNTGRAAGTPGARRRIQGQGGGIMRRPHIL